jgi:poly-gamma-glutamate synthesis protein (capsule biosynthesis protein)
MSWIQNCMNPFSQVSSLFAEANVLIGNLECVISSKSELTGYKAKSLRAPPSAAALLGESGFSVMSVANNHTMDHGPQAFRDTCHLLDKNGIKYCGTDLDPISLRVKSPLNEADLGVAVIGASFRPNQTEFIPLYRLIESHSDLASLYQIVQEASSDADIVMLQCHWGDEFVAIPSSDQVRVAKELVRNGANLIVGHHPHVYQGLQLIGTSPVFFSLGNFVSDMMQSYVRRAAVAVVEVKPNCRLEARAKPIRIDAAHRPILSRAQSDCESLHMVDQNCAISLTREIDSTYSSMLKRAYAKYKRDILLDFIVNLGYMPSAKVEIAKDSIRKVISKSVSLPQGSNHSLHG